MKCRFAGSPQQGGWHRHREPLLKDSCQSVCISGAALDITTPPILHRRYYTADTKSPILNQRAAALFLNRRGVRENIRRIKRHHILVIGSSVAGKSTPCRAA